jgi:hypothetical protein
LNIGRTGPHQLYAEAHPGSGFIIKHKGGLFCGTRIWVFNTKFLDFSSLYPSILFNTEMPLGHGKISVHNKRLDPPWTSSRDNPHKGLIKALIIPPEKIKVPVLPLKQDERLLFPLCRSCAIQHPKGRKDPQYGCPHNEEERSFVGTYTHLELNHGILYGIDFTNFRVQHLKRVIKCLSSSVH